MHNPTQQQLFLFREAGYLSRDFSQCCFNASPGYAPISGFTKLGLNPTPQTTLSL